MSVINDYGIKRMDGALLKSPGQTYGKHGWLQLWRAKYDFSIDGGAQGLITPKTNVLIPDNAIVIGGCLNPTTALTGATATIAVGTSAGSSATSIKAATAVASYSLDAILPVVPLVAASWLKLTADGYVTITVATADLTGGVMDITLWGFVAGA